ncbi:hypothetical protein Golax_023976 [Gossypium laxum]|uniref:Uncharacterized protein n=1 Tax=Gossypium laxum TaxID=34288 RepID=A0A7J8ZC22_9ROSI|nr:hypothetical protein [Gossypium laxum]
MIGGRVKESMTMSLHQAKKVPAR